MFAFAVWDAPRQRLEVVQRVQGVGVGARDPPVAEDTDADRVAHHGQDPLKELRGLSIRLQSEETRA